jgi:hypothetical protein
LPLGVAGTGNPPGAPPARAPPDLILDGGSDLLPDPARYAPQRFAG